MRRWKQLLLTAMLSACSAELAEATEPLGGFGMGPLVRTAQLPDPEPGPNQDVPLEDRLKTLEERFSAFEEQTGEIGDLQESVDDLASDDTIVHSGTSGSTMKISGRVHFDAWGFGEADDNIDIFNADGDVGDPEDPQNRLGFRRLRFGVKGDVLVNMTYKIEMEFAGGNDVEFRDAYLGWEELPYLQKLLLGNQKRPYGLDHLNSSRYNVFLERPFVIEAFNQDARRLGLASYGVSDDLRYNWRYGVWNQRNVQGLGNYVDDHLQLELAGRFANTIWYDEVSDGRGYAHWAVSGTVADPDPNALGASDGDPGDGNEARFRTRPEARSTNRWINTGRIANANAYQLLGLESVVNVGALQLVGEYQTAHVDRINGSEDVHFHGGYAYASYFLTGEHMPWDRETGTLGRPVPFQNFWAVSRCDGRVERAWGAWQVAARYSYADFNDGVFTGTPDGGIYGGEGESFTFGLNWYWNPYARMQLNYITGGINNRAVDDGTLRDGDYDIYGARFMVDF